MKKKFIGVIGFGESGKSTIIRSLTGCRTLNFEGFVTARTLVNEVRSIYVISHSPQETGLNAVRLREIIEQVIQDEDSLGIIMAIQPGLRRRIRLRVGEIYQIIRESNEFDLHAVIINPSFNENEDDIAPEIGLLGDDVQMLVVDGRRFAMISASEINRFVGLL